MIVGHASLNWSRVASKLPQLTNQGDWKESQFWCWVVNRNTCELLFYDDARVITWVKNSLEKIDNEFHVKLKKCVKYHAFVYFFSQPMIWCPLIRDKFCPKCSCGAPKKCIKKVSVI